jgi:hypothetical protein
LAAPSAILPGTRIEVTLVESVDMLRAHDGDTFRAQVLRSVAPPGGNAPATGTAVTLRFSRTPAPRTNEFSSVSVTLAYATVKGRPVPVSSNSFGQMVPTTMTSGLSVMYRAGTRLLFVVRATH